MGRKKLLTEAAIVWAHTKRCRGCKMDAVAATLSVDRTPCNGCSRSAA